MPKAVKLADIAQKLDVSTVTVSKALSGQKGVSEEMRAKIKQLAQEMGYVKTEASDRQKEKKSYTIGVAVAERYIGSNQPFYWQLYQELSQRSVRKNCFAVLEVIPYEMETRMQMPKMVTEEKIEAMILMGTFKMEYTHFLQQNVRLPFLMLDTLSHEGEVDTIVSNNLMGAYRMCNYLFELGHKKIGFVGTRLATTSIDERFLGYLKSAMEHGMQIQNEWLVEDRDRDTGRSDYRTHYCLPDQNMPTAFFCNNDIAANVWIHKLTENGYSVPEDISVVGFDNYMNEPFAQIGITTYAIDTKKMAKRAIHVLLHKLENADYSMGICLIDGTFIERESACRIGPPVPFL